MLNCKSLIDFLDIFKDDDFCLNYFSKIRFKNGKYCPHCKNDKVYQYSNKKLYKCSKCRKQFTIKVGTIFEGSKISMKKWFVAIYLITTNSKGISSVQLAKQVGVTQKTAWFMAQRIRECVNTNGSVFGDVEIDETYVGGKEKNKHFNKKTKGTQGRNTQTKKVVVGVIQRNVYDNEKKVIAKHVEDTKVKTLKKFIKDNVDSKASIISDDYKGYNKLSDYKVNHSAKQYVKDKIFHTNNIENFWSIFKRGYIGVYHYMSKKHLQRYVDEYCFRFNSLKLEFNQVFNDVFIQSNKRLKYKDLING